MKTPLHSRFKVRTLGSLGRKQLLALRRYGTPKKLINLAVCEFEKAARTVCTRAMPYTAAIELTNACNLRCPGCPTGLGIAGRQKGFLSMAHLQKFLDDYSHYLIIANLFNWGESLLHPHAADIVKAVHDRKIFTCVSTNLNIRDPRKLEDVCEAGLDHLIVSLDGSTQESYRQYRRGGDFHLVLENIRRIAEWKRTTNRKFPIIEWQLLSFKHVEPEIADAFRLSKQIGADWFTVRGAVAPPSLQPENSALKGQFLDGKEFCPLLWSNITLQSDGGLAPCCMIYHKRDDFGHIESDDPGRRRNHGRSYEAKRLMNPAVTEALGSTSTDHPCLRCPIVHRLPHLIDAAVHGDQAFIAGHDFQSIVAAQEELDAIRKEFSSLP